MSGAETQLTNLPSAAYGARSSEKQLRNWMIRDNPKTGQPYFEPIGSAGREGGQWRRFVPIDVVRLAIFRVLFMYGLEVGTTQNGLLALMPWPIGWKGPSAKDLSFDDILNAVSKGKGLLIGIQADDHGRVVRMNATTRDKLPSEFDRAGHSLRIRADVIVQDVIDRLRERGAIE